MRVTTKGQVTIPQEIRNRLGLLPYTEVEFDIEGDYVRIHRVEGSKTRGQRIVEAIRGKATTRMTTDEIMAMTRGED